MYKLLKTLLSSALLLGLFVQVNANEMYVFVSNTELKSKGREIAKLFLGVPVHVVKDDGKNVKVTVKGYIDGLNLYSTEKKKLLIATLFKGFKATKKSENEVELSGYIEKGSLTKESAEVWEEHEEFYYEMCTQCHAAPKIPHHSMTEWEALFEPMKGFAKLDAEESEYLLRYIKSNALNGLVKTNH
ncbi:MAG: hypothetical protein K8R44_04930 [Sulfurimonas sp.]|nr:hypothetical protein [Sulfurimonas sp.]